MVGFGSARRAGCSGSGAPEPRRPGHRQSRRRVEHDGSRHRLDHSRHGDTGRQRDDRQESRPRSNRDRPERDGDRMGSSHGPPAMHGDP
uniref:Uncharacterized protein n=1 Tax=uncultured marine virus TaxID=186617 RepID=A0A0F7L955_9VIRU|nr:hypothetical protein [uncultured marine virus]